MKRYIGHIIVIMTLCVCVCVCMCVCDEILRVLPVAKNL